MSNEEEKKDDHSKDDHSKDDKEQPQLIEEQLKEASGGAAVESSYHKVQWTYTELDPTTHADEKNDDDPTIVAETRAGRRSTTLLCKTTRLPAGPSLSDGYPRQACKEERKSSAGGITVQGGPNNSDRNGNGTARVAAIILKARFFGRNRTNQTGSSRIAAS